MVDIYTCTRCGDFHFIELENLHVDSETNLLVERAQTGRFKCSRCGQIVFIDESDKIQAEE